jgi:hypothetical protein
MAVVNRKSQIVTNATTTPVVLSDPALHGGFLRERAAVVTSAADDSATSVFRFFRVSSTSRISQILVSAADATTAGAIDIGIYQTEDNGGAVVDADLFASALDLTAGPYNNSDQTFESGQYTLAETEKPLWEVLGLSADSQREYDVCAVVTTTFNGGPTAIRIAARYTV